MIDDFDEPQKDKPKDKAKRIACGLTWPLHGFPAYYCILRERERDETKTLEEVGPFLEIFEEDEAKSLPELTDKLADLPNYRCHNVYCDTEPKYFSYIREFNRWKREENVSIRLKGTTISSFEAAILKIKQYVTDKKLLFPDASLIKTQLSIFSRVSLKTPEEFYAAMSLCLVIGHFSKRARVEEMDEETQEVPSLRAWY